MYRLVVGKNGPKFKETNPGEPHPGATPVRCPEAEHSPENKMTTG